MFCDGSYYDYLHCGVVATVIRNAQNKELIKKLSEIIYVGNSHESEQMAIYKAIYTLNDMQKYNQLPICSKIKIMGDNQSIINTMNKQFKNTTSKDILTYNTIKEYRKLKENNESVILTWIRRRRNREADVASRIKHLHI